MVSRRSVLKLSLVPASYIFVSNNAYSFAYNSLRLLGGFAGAVGASVVGKYVSDVIDSEWGGRKYSPGIVNTNEAMIENGFDDFSFSETFDKNSNIFYPVGRSDGGESVCVPFIEPHQTEPLTLVEGPSVLGLGVVSSLLYHEPRRAGYASKPNIAQLLMPRAELSRSVGNFESGYQTPTRYLTSAGSVEINYANEEKNDRGGKGVLYVTVRDAHRVVPFEESYNVDYSS